MPVPEALRPTGASHRMRLCDLDETAWDEYGPEACIRLAGEVVGYLRHRALRLPSDIADRHLPAPTAGTRLTDLPIGTRAYNRLASMGYGRHPQRLSECTIGQILGIRGFGVQCLVELLSALESPNHLEPGSLSAAQGGPPPCPLRRYPRDGDPIAPASLRELLEVPERGDIGQRMALQGRLLADLDATVWSVFSRADCDALASRVIARVSRALASLPTRLRNRRLPDCPTDMSIEALGLESRTLHALQRHRQIDLVGDMAPYTVGDIASIPGIGARGLVDLLTRLEATAPRNAATPPSPTPAELAHSLRALPSLCAVTADDPRLGHLVRRLCRGEETIGEWVDRLMHDTPQVPVSETVRRACAELVCLGQALNSKTLEEELRTLVVGASSRRNLEITLRRFGWDGLGGRTLEATGQDLGITRERVRQICHRTSKTLLGRTPYAPVLDRALAYVAEQSPCLGETAASGLAAQGIAASPFAIEGLCHAARMLGRNPSFGVERFHARRTGCILAVVAPLDAPQVAQVSAATARKAVRRWGATTLDDVAATVSARVNHDVSVDFLGNILPALVPVGWLDRSAGWFWITDQRRNRILNQVLKILSVCTDIDISELRSSVSRDYRSQGFAPPRRVLLELCRQAPFCRIDGRRVQVTTSLDWRSLLTDAEQILFRAIHRLGPLAHKTTLEATCLSAGMNPHTFQIILSNSPVVVRYGPSVYGLVGADVRPGDVDRLTYQNRRHRVLQDYGWESNGIVWVVYAVSRGMLVNGACSIPAALHPHISGEFALVTETHERIGLLVTKGTSAWGLRSLFRRRGGEAGDHLLLRFDVRHRTVMVEIGGPDLLERYAA